MKKVRERDIRDTINILWGQNVGISLSNPGCYVGVNSIFFDVTICDTENKKKEEISQKIKVFGEELEKLSFGNLKLVKIKINPNNIYVMIAIGYEVMDWYLKISVISLPVFLLIWNLYL